MFSLQCSFNWSSKMSSRKGTFVLSLLCSLSFLNIVGTARILCIYTVPFDSHQSVFQVITEELAQRGHELVVITPLPHRKPLQNVTEIDIHDMAHRVWEDTYSTAQKRHSSITTDPVTLFAEVIMPLMREMIEIQILAPEVQEIILDKRQHFDVILMEACVSANLIFAARFNAPVILISSFYGTENNFLTMGATVHPLFFPDFNLQTYSFHTTWEGFTALKNYVLLRYYEWQAEIIGDSLIRKHFGENAPNLRELKKYVQMMFLNVHHIWDNNRPVPPSVVYMGALHLKEPKPLPEDLQSYLDSSHNGVVYISLGSKLRFSDLPPQTLRVFLNVFSSIPYDVLIKWNGAELPDKPANVQLEKWLPQNDMLHHPKIKAFIMQGGLQSTDEAVAAKVPMLALPVFGDQFYNAHKYVKHGIGVTLDINTLEENELRGAILKLIEDKSYRTNIARLGRIMAEQGAGGLQKAMYWIEYTATHGADHLRSPLADATVQDYLLLDYLGLVCALLAVSIVFASLVVRVVALCVVPLVNAMFTWKCKRKYKSH